MSTFDYLTFLPPCRPTNCFFLITDSFWLAVSALHVLIVPWILKKSQNPTIYLHAKDASQSAGESTTQCLLNPVERIWEKYRLWTELWWSSLWGLISLGKDYSSCFLARVLSAVGFEDVVSPLTGMKILRNWILGCVPALAHLQKG